MLVGLNCGVLLTVVGNKIRVDAHADDDLNGALFDSYNVPTARQLDLHRSTANCVGLSSKQFG